MDPFYELGSLQRQKSGQTICPKCNKQYNNRALPNKCFDCQAFLGGSFKPTEKGLDAQLITSTLASVRLNKAGPNKRVFVDLKQAKCFNKPCIQTRGALSKDERTNRNFCDHVAQAREAYARNCNAKVAIVNLCDVLSKVTDETLEVALQNESSDGEIIVYILPGDNIAVPVITKDNDEFMADYVHLHKLKCELDSCNKKAKTKLHTLVVKGVGICQHSLLGHLLKKSDEDVVKKDSIHYIDFDLTIKDVIAQIKKDFPATFKDCQNSEFVTKSRNFVDSLVSFPVKLEQILKTIPSNCRYCDILLDDWNHKKPKSYFMTMGHLKEITIELKVCPKCRRAFYPEFYQNGVLFIHNKFMLTIETILDLNNALQTGGGFIEAVKKKMLLLGKLEGLTQTALEKDLTNNVLKLEKIVIAVMSLMVTGSDLDDVVCFTCGNCPKIVSTDGNTKDSIRVRKNMKFDYSDTSEVQDLQDFKEELIEELMRSAFFQCKSDKNWNMLKLPIIAAPTLIRKQVNNDATKQSIMEKEFKYEEETLNIFQTLIDSKQLKISNIPNLKLSELQMLATQLGIFAAKKTGEIIRIDLTNLSKILLAGQGVCHTYIYERGRTGGWQDMFCSHLFKVSAKMQACQESVSDPSDLVHSLKKMPVVHICDDACTFVSHSLLRYPIEAEIAFGQKRGCFQKPNDTVEPLTNISCPDITPIELEQRKPNREAMLNPSQLVHPDVTNQTRYVLGTRLQMRKSGTSHKRKSCSYHDLDKSREGCMIKSMNQEAMQLVRKSKTIQQDKMRSLETCFLANMLQDYFHNLKKKQEELKRFQKIEGFKEVKRDSLTHRACPVFEDRVECQGSSQQQKRQKTS